MNNQTIGILGSGAVGQTLATGFLKHGYQVTIGTRNPEKLAEWNKQNPAGQVASFEDTAKAELLVLAVKGIVAEDILSAIGEAHLEGKTIIDATNPIANDPPENGVLKFFTYLNESLMERLQKAHPKAHFVKAFNSVGSAYMVNPAFTDGTPTMFIAGNNDAAKGEVNEILELFGWEVEDMGKAEGARAIEPLSMLWCIPGFLRNHWTHAFKLMKA